MSIVEVRPLPLKKWHGKKGKESFATPKTVEVLYSPTTGRYATGLTDEEAEKLGKELGLDLSANFNPTEAHPYWGSRAAAIKLQNNTMIFDTDKPFDLIKVKNMKASKLVANSLKEWEEGKADEATHYIHSQEDEVKDKATKANVVSKIYAGLTKLDLTAKQQLVLVIDGKNIKGRSEEFTTAALADIIEDKPDELLRWIMMDTEALTKRALVLEALSKNILTKQGAAIYYMSEKLGHDVESAITALEDTNNQTLKVAILEKLEATKK